MRKRGKKTLAARLKVNGKRKIRNLLSNRQAASVVVSTIVLTAGVLAMGIAVLYWAYSWGNIANRTYASAEANSAKAVQERLGFEYIDYSRSSNILTVNLINWGTVGTVDIVNVHLWDNMRQPLGNYSNPSLKNITNDAAISSLNITDEGYFQITPVPPLALNSLYYIRVVTERGRTFDSSFATP
jgi:hypothetical protein